MKINHLDLFSGIGGFHKGFQQAGYKVNSYFSEIDKHAIAVYKNQFKDAEYVGSVVNLKGDELPRINLVTFGSPCQDFSLAGKRKGMSGDRSSLVLEAIRLISECRPGVFIWENVKGTFSSNSGEDFAAILQAFTNIGGYRLEWQLLNTSWFLPQNRERIYLVGYSTTTKRNWRGVFPIGESSRKDSIIQGHNPRANTITTRYTGNANGSFIGECKQPTQEIGDFRSDEGWRPRKDGNCPTLAARAREDGSGQPLLKGNYHIRRLTPIECERLQGFPDNHTEYGNYDGEVKKMSNTQRYKQCGNAVTVDVVQAIAEKIKPLFNNYY